MDSGYNMKQDKGIIFPASLKKGDKIALLSPSSAVKEEYVYGAMDKIMERGYEPVLMPNALGHVSGSFASTRDERLIDLLDALKDPEIKAILCTRGGYGASQLLMNFDPEIISKNPKWLIGFSDISALHAMWCVFGVASIHGPMAKHLATKPSDDECTRSLFEMLENGGRFDYTFPSHKYNREGIATGELRGGNLIVLNDLASTPFDILDVDEDFNGNGIILFIEDIGEAIYKVNRMLWRMELSDTISRLKGIIFGQFTDYHPDKNFKSMEDMMKDFIQTTLHDYSIPVVYDFPVGHIENNYPLTEGAMVELSVTKESVRLRTLH